MRVYFCDLQLKITRMVETSNGKRSQAANVLSLCNDNSINNGNKLEWRTMDLFILYVLFSHFRPGDVPKGIFLLFFHELSCSAGNNFSSFTGHMSFQIFLLVGHLTNWTGHNLLTDNTLKKRTQDMLVKCSVIVSDHNVKLAGHFQNLVGQCPMCDCYFQHWLCIHKNLVLSTELIT